MCTPANPQSPSLSVKTVNLFLLQYYIAPLLITHCYSRIFSDNKSLCVLPTNPVSESGISMTVDQNKHHHMISTNPFQEIVDSLRRAFASTTTSITASVTPSAPVCVVSPMANLAPYSGLEEGCNIFFSSMLTGLKMESHQFPLRDPSSPL